MAPELRPKCPSMVAQVSPLTE
jgi:hypothetical protein